VYHSGENPGFRAFAAWLPDSDRRLVVLANQAEVNAVLLGGLLAAD
jgi:hypothetical protein